MAVCASPTAVADRVGASADPPPRRVRDHAPLRCQRFQCTQGRQMLLGHLCRTLASHALAAGSDSATRSWGARCGMMKRGVGWHCCRRDAYWQACEYNWYCIGSVPRRGPPAIVTVVGAKPLRTITPRTRACGRVRRGRTHQHSSTGAPRRSPPSSGIESSTNVFRSMRRCADALDVGMAHALALVRVHRSKSRRHRCTTA